MPTEVTKVMKIAIVDDEPLARAGVRAQLAHRSDIKISAEYQDGESALAGLTLQPVDLVFLDIEMPVKNGLEVLSALPAKTRPLAILLTAHESFAIRAFALGVVDYLLKPIDGERFTAAMERAQHRLKANFQHAELSSYQWTQRFRVRVGRVNRLISTHKIRWIAADGDYVSLHTDTGAHLLRESLQEISQQLDPKRFIRVHRSAIVALDHISEMSALPNRDALLRLSDGTPLRVSRNYIDSLLLALQG